MKLENQIANFYLSKKLKELGVKQESLFYWDEAYCKSGKPQLKFVASEKLGINACEFSAFTVAELGEILPEQVANKKMFGCDNFGGTWQVYYYDESGSRFDEKSIYIKADTEADARAKMIIHLIEEGLYEQKPAE